MPAETQAERDARMRWWREARFGMFIHWGLYAVPAGEYQGKRGKDIGEWIMSWANIPRAEYEKFAPQFNPTGFDAAEWVRIAKNAGMKYIVITSKHHDGFSMFDSAVSSYDIVDSTPYHKDVIKALSAETKRQGLKFCFYYSIMDWHHPSQAPTSREKDPDGGRRKDDDKPGAEGRIRRLHEVAAEGARHAATTRKCSGSMANGWTGGPSRTARISMPTSAA